MTWSCTCTCRSWSLQILYFCWLLVLLPEICIRHVTIGCIIHVLVISAETNTSNIRIFVCFVLFEHNLCYPTIRLQPCGFALCIVSSTTWSWDAHNWWKIFCYQDKCSAHTIIVPKIHISTNYSTIRLFDMWIFEYTKVVFVSALVIITGNYPNLSDRFEAVRVVEQLRACGVLETVRISAAGYPSRWSYTDFFIRYRPLIPSGQLIRNDHTHMCQWILQYYIKVHGYYM